MAIIIGVAAFIFWLYLQRHMQKQGIEPLSRGQMRYWRRKARKSGTTLDQVSYKPRRRK